MKKRTKKEVKADWDKIAQETMEWTGTKDMLKSTDSATAEVRTDLYKVNQSINQKTERSEQDIKERFSQVVFPLAILIIIDIIISYANLVR